MTEVARAIVLPHVMQIEVRKLLSLLLVWDSVELTTPGRYDDDDSPDGEAFRELLAEGLVRRPVRDDIPKSRDEAMQRWISSKWDFVAEHPDPDYPATYARELVTEALAGWVGRVRGSVELASEKSLPSVALGAFEAQAAALPAVDPDAPIAESTLIQTASQSAVVATDTRVADLLAFRGENQALMGQFRAALVDLAAAIHTESPIAAAEQAQAIVANRVEPSLARLEEALSESQIRFAWNTMIGATSVVLGGMDTPLAAATGTGSILMRNLRYAFDKDRLVRDHPFGLLHRVTSEFGPSAPAHETITDPEEELRESLAGLVEGGIRAALSLRSQATSHD